MSANRSASVSAAVPPRSLRRDNARARDPLIDRLRQDLAERLGELRLDPRMRLAEIVAAGVQRTAQGADRPRVSGAGGHVLRLERMLADAALDRLEVLPAPFWFARDVVFAVGGPCDQGSRNEGDSERDERRERLGGRAKQSVKRADRNDGRDRHGADADRVDVVEMRALELDVLRAQPKRLVDDEVGDQRADPGNRDVGIKRQRLLQRLVDADFH